MRFDAPIVEVYGVYMAAGKARCYICGRSQDELDEYNKYWQKNLSERYDSELKHLEEILTAEQANMEKFNKNAKGNKLSTTWDGEIAQRRQAILKEGKTRAFEAKKSPFMLNEVKTKHEVKFESDDRPGHGYPIKLVVNNPPIYICTICRDLMKREEE